MHTVETLTDKVSAVVYAVACAIFWLGMSVGALTVMCWVIWALMIGHLPVR